jgi:gluconate 2-dehydrogenase gamma chain
MARANNLITRANEREGAEMGTFSRRDLIKSTGIVGIAALAGGSPGADAQQNEDNRNEEAKARPDGSKAADRGSAGDDDVLRFFNTDEAQFIAAAVERLIPADDRWGGAGEAGVLYYIDHQLASVYGSGAKMYLDGPWDPQGFPGQGYQLRYSPAELYRVGIAEIRDQVKQQYKGKEFWELGQNDQDTVLADLDMGNMKLPSMPSTVFFETLLANTIEGYFSDPIYGGNRNMVGWRLVGFPGAYAQYLGLVDQHGFELRREPIGISNADAVLSLERQGRQERKAG